MQHDFLVISTGSNNLIHCLKEHSQPVSMLYAKSEDAKHAKGLSPQTSASTSDMIIIISAEHLKGNIEAKLTQKQSSAPLIDYLR